VVAGAKKIAQMPLINPSLYRELSLLDDVEEWRRRRAGERLRLRGGGERPPPRPPRPTGERLRPPRRGGERRPRGDGDRLRPRGEGERRRPPPRGEGERLRPPRGGEGERRRLGEGAARLGAGRGIRTGAAVTSCMQFREK
jgi:hypothetical protein